MSTYFESRALWREGCMHLKELIQSGMRLLNVSISLFAVTVFEMIIWSVKTTDAWAALAQQGCLKY